MKKIILHTLAALTLSAESSSAAMLMTVQDVGDDIVISFTGTLNFVGGTLIDSGLTAQDGETRDVRSQKVYNMNVVLGDTPWNTMAVTRLGGLTFSGSNFTDSNITGTLSPGFYIYAKTSGAFVTIYDDSFTQTGNDTQEVTSISGTSAMDMIVLDDSVANHNWSPAYDTTSAVFSVDGTDDLFNILVVDPVPEPSSTALLGLGGLALLLRRRR